MWPFSLQVLRAPAAFLWLHTLSYAFTVGAWIKGETFVYLLNTFAPRLNAIWNVNHGCPGGFFLAFFYGNLQLYNSLILTWCIHRHTFVKAYSANTNVFKRISKWTLTSYPGRKYRSAYDRLITKAMRPKNNHTPLLSQWGLSSRPMLFLFWLQRQPPQDGRGAFTRGTGGKAQLIHN